MSSTNKLLETSSHELSLSSMAIVCVGSRLLVVLQTHAKLSFELRDKTGLGAENMKGRLVVLTLGRPVVRMLAMFD